MFSKNQKFVLFRKMTEWNLGSLKIASTSLDFEGYNGQESARPCENIRTTVMLVIRKNYQRIRHERERAYLKTKKNWR